MKSKKYNIFIFSVLFCIITLFFHNIKIYAASISPSSVSISVGATKQLTASPARSSYVFNWSSTSPSVASVKNDGTYSTTVKGIKSGTCTIKVHITDVTYERVATEQRNPDGSYSIVYSNKETTKDIGTASITVTVSGGSTTTPTSPSTPCTNHSYVFQYSSKATCTNDGQNHYRCRYCSSTKSTPGEKSVGHDIQSYNVNNPPICTKCNATINAFIPGCLHPIGGKIPVTMLFWQQYEKEKYTISIYNSNGTRVGSGSKEYTSKIREGLQYLTLYWDTSNVSAGKYSFEIEHQYYNDNLNIWMPSSQIKTNDIYNLVEDSNASDGNNNYEDTTLHIVHESTMNQDANDNTICSAKSAYSITKFDTFDIRLTEMYLGSEANNILQSISKYNMAAPKNYRWILMAFRIHNTGLAEITASNIFNSTSFYKHTGIRYPVVRTAFLNVNTGYVSYKRLTIAPDETKDAWIAICADESYGLPYLRIGNCYLNTNPKYIDFNNDSLHSYSTSTKSATCTQDGIIYKECSSCNHKIILETLPATGHKWNSGYISKEPSCTATGIRTLTCLNCNVKASKTIAKLTHKYQKIYAKATLTTSGYSAEKCSLCKTVRNKVTYSNPKTISLAKTTYVYTGSAVKPAVTIKGADGKVIANTNYKVTYSNAKSTNVGTYTTKIVFKGNYSGAKTLSYKINPKATSITSLATGPKALTVKWSKISTQTTGYQVQYATVSNFSGAVTKIITKNTTISLKATSLKAKKKYFVRVRTYKTVNNVKHYSAWSAVKTIITK